MKQTREEKQTPTSRSDIVKQSLRISTKSQISAESRSSTEFPYLIYIPHTDQDSWPRTRRQVFRDVVDPFEAVVPFVHSLVMLCWIGYAMLDSSA